MQKSLILMCGAALVLQGCIARTAASVVTAPVRAAGQVVDWSTTSQEEADRNLGRQVRQREAEIGRLERDRRRAQERCQNGNADACQQVQTLTDQIARLNGTPYGNPR